jgi:hypothetical protein
MNAHQIMLIMGFGTYRTAWRMCRKIRVAMTGDIKRLGGIVEVDETFVGGKDKDKVRDKHGSGGTAGVGSNNPLIAAVTKRNRTRDIGNRALIQTYRGALVRVKWGQPRQPRARGLPIIARVGIAPVRCGGDGPESQLCEIYAQSFSDELMAKQVCRDERVSPVL